MNQNNILAYGIIGLGAIGLICGAILAGSNVDTTVTTALILVGSNALSAIAGALTAKGHSPPNSTAG